ncbi:G-protein coupled receptor daf-37 [Eurytemora carolleeae]|uniref:G-protein coupled receptor daf-37 n=1 Tax=Eurytemora carolleeae TaxID=1294199 RepID=UPI000C7945FD|nr:G-protein coupled receptor daf-37 [Eurytemora carolleeae]|eukprot:XP_023324911.1 G-protein coupled receptor daf-37-like [Eurytemora affinis]
MRRSSFNQLLLILAGYDIAYLISSTVVFGLPNLSETYRETYHVWFLPIFYALAHISRIGSALLTLSISVERYVAITKPFFAKKKMVKSCLIKFSIIFSICYNIPR